MIAEKSDEELLALAAAGDEAAFAILVQRHQSRVFNLAYRFSRDRQDAEDLAQEVFFKVWRHARTFKGQAAFSTWLYRLAVNTCLNHRQQKKSRPFLLPLTADLDSGAEADATKLESRQREALLGQAMDALPARQKMAIVLAGFEQKSYEETAAAMNVSIPAVESLLFRARKNLAAALRSLKNEGGL